MWDNISAELVGERIALEPLTADHQDALFEAARPAEIWEFTQIHETVDRPSPNIESFRQGFASILSSAREGSRVPFATRELSTGLLIGSTSFCTLRPQHRGLEIGWTWLTPKAWGTGANAEAKYLMLLHAFEELGCQRVELETDALNVRSRRAIEALPATFEGILRDWKLVGGRRRSSAMYSILDNEWPAVRASLESRLARYLTAL